MDFPAVEVTSLTMRYGSTRAVDGLNLTVQTGSLTAVLGPNGAGKTTTIETCEGFRRVQDGSVRVLGLDPITDARQLRPRVGVMLQSGGAWSGVRAGEMLRHMASLHAHPLDVGELMERLGLQASDRTPYRRMSGGQQQRLSLAMALVGRPELLFLDEPTAGMDPQARRATWDIISELRYSGASVVLTTHFMDEAEHLADYIYILDHGRVIASGTATELATVGAHETIQMTVSQSIDAQRLRNELEFVTRIQTLDQGRYTLHGRISPETVSELTTWLARENVLLHSLLVEQQRLEDRFLELTGRDLR